jgi:hypothetical protein
MPCAADGRRMCCGRCRVASAAGAAGAGRQSCERCQVAVSEAASRRPSAGAFSRTARLCSLQQAAPRTRFAWRPGTAWRSSSGALVAEQGRQLGSMAMQHS